MAKKTEHLWIVVVIVRHNNKIILKLTEIIEAVF
jgi:hypothetical protein